MQKDLPLNVYFYYSFAFLCYNFIAYSTCFSNRSIPSLGFYGLPAKALEVVCSLIYNKGNGYRQNF